MPGKGRHIRVVHVEAKKPDRAERHQALPELIGQHRRDRPLVLRGKRGREPLLLRGPTDQLPHQPGMAVPERLLADGVHQRLRLPPLESVGEVLIPSGE
jgi:hypothetical protein